MAVAEAKAILAFEQFLFSVIYPITLQPSFPREGFMVVAGWFECFSGSQFVAVCPGGSCCGSALCAAAATSNLWVMSPGQLSLHSWSSLPVIILMHTEILPR